ncbi:MAG: hypothetical protein AAB692_05300 [Patescibacteria group bacterium]
MPHQEHTATKIDPAIRARFWEAERSRLLERNAALAAEYAAKKTEIDLRRATQEKILITCMDERNTHIEESLGFLPGEARVFASGGGKADLAAFVRVFGELIVNARRAGAKVSVFLVPHECSHDAALGCAAFGNDTEAQRQFFTALKSDILRAFPNVSAHVMAFCTTTHKLREIDCHEADAFLGQVQDANAEFDRRSEDTSHAGHGIYVGDAYRAWVPERNRYFRLSPLNPALEGNITIALTVMVHHSEVNLDETPAMLHIDYPRYADTELAVAAREHIDRSIAPFVGRADLHVVKTETDVETWQGRMLT